jgi:hypothetical protein
MTAALNALTPPSDLCVNPRIQFAGAFTDDVPSERTEYSGELQKAHRELSALGYRLAFGTCDARLGAWDCTESIPNSVDRSSLNLSICVGQATGLTVIEAKATTEGEFALGELFDRLNTGAPA